MTDKKRHEICLPWRAQGAAHGDAESCRRTEPPKQIEIQIHLYRNIDPYVQNN
jgi:hypothetical protein